MCNDSLAELPQAMPPDLQLIEEITRYLSCVDDVCQLLLLNVAELLLICC